MLSPTNRFIELKKSCNSLLIAAKFYQPLLLALSIVVAGESSVLADSITPNNDGTGTVVNTDGNRIDIEGGSLSGDGKNLFHSFEQFGLSSEQIANFMSNPDIRNILGRINGGDPSVINGLLQVTGGNSNLLLMNPAGIIFGENAQLNVPGDFTATTATGIDFDSNLWFNAVGENGYQSLVGTPNQFAFDNGNPAAIINNGELSLAEGKNLTLLGGNVVNTGKITAPEGSVTISAIPGSSSVRISQPGHLLSLDIEPPRDDAGNVLPFAAKDLPELLTSAGDVDTGLTPNEDGSITNSDAGTSILPEAELAIASGNINVSGITGGEVNLTGNKVGVLSGNIDATGTDAGCNVRVGGGYQGGGVIPNASHFKFDENSTIAVDATDNGNGGQAIVWSESLTRMTGNITARGGTN
ncbi:MAG: filamentous hemagglutinin N-terminal domain-containing protein, partial [Pleurocapsa sp.]